MLLPIRDCGKGVNKDTLPAELAPGLWSDALNVEFSDGSVRHRLGIQSVYTTPTAVPYFVMTYISAAARFLVQASTDSVFVDDGSTRTDITGVAPTGGRDDKWSGGDLNGVLVMNNRVDAPQYWNGDVATNLAALTAWPAGYIADFCRPFKNYLIFGSITKAGVKYRNLVLWSNAAEPGAIPTAYTSASTNDAGEDPVEQIGGLVDALPLGDSMILYGETGRCAMQYVGGNDVFAFRRLPGNDGLMAVGCVAETPVGHVFLCNGDVMLHNGGEARSIAQGRVKRWLFSTMDPTNASRSFLVVNAQRSEVWLHFPSSGSADCDKVLAWNWSDDTWAIHSIANVTHACSGLVASALLGNTNDAATGTIDSDTATNDQDEGNANEARLVIATSTPQIGLANVGSTDFGSTFTYYAERSGIRPSDENAMFFVRRSQWDFDGTAGTQVTVSHGMSKTADGDPSASYVSATHTQGTTDWANCMSRRGRYASIKFTGTSGQQMSLRTVRLDLRGCGQE
jgi:hypothetical protein